MNYKAITTKLLTALLLLTAVATLCSAQTALSTTTLTTAVDNKATTWNITTTSMLSSGPANQINTVLYIDRELVWVTTVIDSTHVLVQRGKGQTRPFAHAAGTKVYFGSPSGNFLSNFPNPAESYGSCIATNEVSLPKIYVTTGDIFDCKNSSSGGQWIQTGNGTMGQFGSEIRGFCTGTVGSAETEYLNGAACSGATTSTARYVISSIGTLANLQVYSSANAVGGTSKDVLTVVKNGTATAVTCTIAAAAATCSDTSNSVNVVPGDVITFKFVTATTDTAANISVAVGLY